MPSPSLSLFHPRHWSTLFMNSFRNRLILFLKFHTEIVLWINCDSLFTLNFVQSIWFRIDFVIDLDRRKKTCLFYQTVGVGLTQIGNGNSFCFNGYVHKRSAIPLWIHTFTFARCLSHSFFSLLKHIKYNNINNEGLAASVMKRRHRQQPKKKKKEKTSSKTKEQNSKTTSIYYVWQEHQLWFELCERVKEVEEKERQKNVNVNDMFGMLVCVDVRKMLMYCKYRPNDGKSNNNDDDSKEMDNGNKKTHIRLANKEWGRRTTKKK